mmetsp:Transcript_121335/g.241699  ORF Transcript_121335/g.241699 Transcript_121335/m.241699 type:complete len:325 (-) Transcript_121335:77-1051(-)
MACFKTKVVLAWCAARGTMPSLVPDCLAFSGQGPLQHPKAVAFKSCLHLTNSHNTVRLVNAVRIVAQAPSSAETVPSGTVVIKRARRCLLLLLSPMMNWKRWPPKGLTSPIMLSHMTVSVGVLDVIAWGRLEKQRGRPVKLLLTALRSELCCARVVTRQELLPVALGCWWWSLVLPFRKPVLHSLRDLPIMVFMKLPPSPSLLLLVLPDSLRGFNAKWGIAANLLKHGFEFGFTCLQAACFPLSPLLLVILTCGLKRLLASRLLLLALGSLMLEPGHCVLPLGTSGNRGCTSATSASGNRGYHGHQRVGHFLSLLRRQKLTRCR